MGAWYCRPRGRCTWSISPLGYSFRYSGIQTFRRRHSGLLSLLFILQEYCLFLTEVVYWMVLVKSSKLLPPQKVSSCPSHLHPDPVISLIHWVGHPSGLGLAQMVAMELTAVFGQAPPVWVVIVAWRL